MPSKKKKYNARFPAGRIKKIMQSDEEVGKVAQAVPVIISKTLELFVESLLVKSLRITTSRNAKTLSPSHMKQCIMAESRFDFLRELVKNIPDISVAEEISHDNSPGPPPHDPPAYDLTMPSTSCGITIQASPSTTNGNSLRNGIEFHVPIPPVQRSASVPCGPQRGDLKRSAAVETPYDAGRFAADFYKESPVIRHTSRSDGSSTAAVSAADMIASYSADFYKENVAVIKHTSDVTPTKVRRLEDTVSVSALPSLPTQTSVRRLQHQSKSIPCTSKESQQQQQQQSSSLQLTSHAHPIITPAPIINVDICNKPVVKIDYSNLALPETQPTDCTRNEETSKNLASVCISPVINIDLSNIVPKPKSTLDLDEDYDNI